MNDMSAVIVPKSDQLNSDDLIGGPRTITITGVAISPGTEQPVAIRFEGDDNKPWKPCKSMSRVLVQAWGPDAKLYVGRSLTLYRDPKVKWGGLEVGGIRISHLSHIENDMVMALTETRGKRTPFKVCVLADAPKQPTADKARAALDKVLANIARAPTVEKLDAFLAGEKIVAAVGDLQNERADLFAEYEAAVAKRREELAPADDDPFADEPADPALTERLRVLRLRIADADTPEVKAAIADDWARERALHDAETQAEIDAAVAALA